MIKYKNNLQKYDKWIIHAKKFGFDYFRFNMSKKSIIEYENLEMVNILKKMRAEQERAVD